jgi:hypothetical protein
MELCLQIFHEQLLQQGATKIQESSTQLQFELRDHFACNPMKTFQPLAL